MNASDGARPSKLTLLCIVSLTAGFAAAAGIFFLLPSLAGRPHRILSLALAIVAALAIWGLVVSLILTAVFKWSPRK